MTLLDYLALDKRVASFTLQKCNAGCGDSKCNNVMLSIRQADGQESAKEIDKGLLLNGPLDPDQGEALVSVMVGPSTFENKGLM